MQPTPSTSNKEFFLCRSCYSHQPKDSHSQRSCLKAKRDALQTIEDRLFGRELFIKNSKAKITKRASEQTVETTQIDTTVTEKPEAIFKRPRVLRRRRIAPVAWSSSISSFAQKNNQQIEESKKPAAFNSQNTEETLCNQPAQQQFGGNKNLFTPEPTHRTQ